MHRSDWLLLAISEGPDKGLSPIQIQKIRLLLKMEAPKHVGPQFYSFIPYNDGPFSEPIYHDIERLIISDRVRTVAPGRYPLYAITSKGAEDARVLAKNIKPKARDYVTKVVQWVSRVDFNQLLRSIYAKYPDYATKSIFRQ